MEARRRLNLAALEGTSVAGFRLRPGDDASCLNLYVPQSPRVLAASARFIAEGRFAFQRSLAESPEEKANPWLLLRRRFADEAVPVIADANSLTYVLKKAVGDDITMAAAGRTIHLRVVGALSDSVFQRELVMGESQFQRSFSGSVGYRCVWRTRRRSGRRRSAPT
jgi:hypothetical protein